MPVVLPCRAFPAFEDIVAERLLESDELSFPIADRPRSAGTLSLLASSGSEVAYLEPEHWDNHDCSSFKAGSVATAKLLEATHPTLNSEAVVLCVDPTFALPAATFARASSRGFFLGPE